jgi:serine/threonine protein kinase
MSASIDKDAANGSEDARGVLASWLDKYTAGRCGRADMQASFLEICRRNPEAPWDALALLDQYQRRGRVDVTLARSLKADIAQLVFGVANQTEASHEPNPQDAPNEKPSDTTGSRWRKLAAERDLHTDPGDLTRVRGGFEPRPSAQPKPEFAAERPAPERTASSSRTVLRDRYELQTVLGRGSAGTVYKALDRHRAHLADAAQCVAVKVLKLKYQQMPEALAELEREFHQAQSLSHPNIVSMFDLDRDGDTYFLVMELLEGELLASVLERLDQQPMARHHALSIVGSIGIALAHAHRRDVVHGDLKPRNVMITFGGEVKVLDFGFARSQPLEPWIGELPGEGPVMSHTPAYASAERVNGQELHASEDVYSLACIAYELLAGEHPYGGRSAPLARAHGREPVRIASLSNKQWNALRTALRWSRDERLIDVVGLLSALGCAEVPQHLPRPHELVATKPPGPGTQGRRLAMGGLLLLVLAVAAGLFWSESWLPPKNAAVAPVASQAPENSVTPQAPPAANAPPSDSPEEVVAAPETLPPAVDMNTPAAPAARPQESAPEKRVQKAPLVESATGAASEASAARGRELIQFDKDTYVATESDGSVTLTVRRTGSTRDEALFRWSLQSNSAEAGNDFAAIGPNIERIPAGSRTAVLTIPLVSDAITENTELFLVELSAVEGSARLAERGRAAVILVDDD